MNTTKTATPVARFAPTDAGDLNTRGDSASFFAVSPVKGARIDGTVAVGMSSHELDGPQRYGPKVSHPAMWIDFTPMFSGKAQKLGAATRRAITVNGREYGAAMFETVSGYVEFYPVSQYSHLRGYPVMTVAGVEYVLRFRLSMFDTVSDAAHRVLEALANAIAVEYVTDVRWLGYRADTAKRAAANAADEVNQAQSKYNAARETLDAANAAYLAAVKAADK